MDFGSFTIKSVRTFLLVTVVAAATAACGAGLPTSPSSDDSSATEARKGSGALYPAFAGALDQSARKWSRIVEGSVPSLTNDAGNNLLAPIPVAANATRSLNYLFSPASRNISAVQTMTIELEVITTGTPQFQHDGGAGGLPPSVRPFFWSYNINDYNTESARWWSQDYVVLACGASTITVSMDPSRWSNVNGRFGSELPAQFAAARAATVAIGVTFGGGSSFGHGVSVIDGTASFVLKRYEVR